MPGMATGDVAFAANVGMAPMSPAPSEVPDADRLMLSAGEERSPPPPVFELLNPAPAPAWPAPATAHGLVTGTTPLLVEDAVIGLLNLAPAPAPPAPATAHELVSATTPVVEDVYVKPSTILVHVILVRANVSAAQDV
jgi:hypothetical protein